MVVLLAEDEALIALSLADLLEAEGLQVVVASNGAEALDMARHLGDALDVLVTDLNMPFMTGEDLIHTLRKDQPELPVVVVTGSPPSGGLAELVRYGGGRGPLTLLQKPVDYTELANTVWHAASNATSGKRVRARGRTGCPRSACASS